MVFQDSSRKLEKILVLIISRNLSSLEYHGVLKVETCPDRALTTPNRQVDQAKMPISGRTTPRFQLPDGCSFADHTSRGCCLSTCFHHPANDHMKLYDTGICCSLCKHHPILFILVFTSSACLNVFLTFNRAIHRFRFTLTGNKPTSKTKIVPLLGVVSCNRPPQ